MKRILLFSILLICLQQTNAQKFSVKWGKAKKSKYALYSVINGSGNDLVRLNMKYPRGGSAPNLMDISYHLPATPKMVRYDEQMNELGIRTIEKSDKKVVVNRFISIKGKLYMFMNKFDHKTRSTRYYCQAFSPITLQPTGELMQIAAVEEEKKSQASTITTLFSSDSSKILTFIEPAEKKGSNRHYSMIVFDSDMKEFGIRILNCLI